MTFGPWRRLSGEELMPLNCSVEEDSWEPWMQGDQTNPKGNQPRIFIGRTDAKADAPILWPPDAMSQLIGKDVDGGKGWREKKREVEEEMVRQHHRCNGHEFEQTLGDSEWKGSLVCCSPWICKESDMAYQLRDWIELRSLLDIHFNYRSVYMSISNSLTVPSLHPSPCNDKSTF